MNVVTMEYMRYENIINFHMMISKIPIKSKVYFLIKNRPLYLDYRYFIFIFILIGGNERPEYILGVQQHS